MRIVVWAGPGCWVYAYSDSMPIHAMYKLTALGGFDKLWEVLGFSGQLEDR